MSTQVRTVVGRVVWHEHQSSDPERAIAFYTELLDWTTEIWKRW